MHSLEITEIVPERCTPCGPAGKQPVMGGPATEPPPKAFNNVALGAITRQPIEAQMGMGRQDLLHARAAMPRGIINRDDDLGIHACRIHPRNLLEVHGKGRLQALRFTVPRPRLTVGGLVEQARR